MASLAALSELIPSYNDQSYKFVKTMNFKEQFSQNLDNLWL